MTDSSKKKFWNKWRLFRKKEGTDPFLKVARFKQESRSKSCIISDIWSYSYGCGNWPSTFQAAGSKGSNERLRRGCKIQSKSPKNLGISPDVYLLGGLQKLHTAMQVCFNFKKGKNIKRQIVYNITCVVLLVKPILICKSSI